MSIAIKNSAVAQGDIWVRDPYEKTVSDVAHGGSPWGRGFAVGLGVALLLLLPVFFVSIFVGSAMKPEVAQAERNFSLTPTTYAKDYLEVQP